MLTNYWCVSKTAESDPSRPRPRLQNSGLELSPDQDHNLKDYISVFNINVKVKVSHTRYQALGPELIPMYRQSARRWL